MPTEFEFAIEQITEEKGISKEAVIETIESAIAAAFRKDYGKKGQNIEAKFEPETGKTQIYDVQEIVEEVEKEEREITLEEGKKLKKGAKIGDIIKTDVTPDEINFGRIAAQTAKQVIIQKIREAEKNAIFDAYKGREGELINGVVQRAENRLVFVDLGQATGILPPPEQIKNESYRIGDRIRVLIVSVNITPKGPEIILSRTHTDVINKLFEMEVPEIAAGTVVIKSIAREAGSRSKVAVYTTQEEIDPIGACVGQRGARIQTIISEISGEKIDIIEWDENEVKFISNALSPAKVMSVKLNEKDKHAVVEVVEEQLSLAIGRDGQNVRLAVKLTGWNIDVVKEGVDDKAKKEDKEDKQTKPDEKEEKAENKDQDVKEKIKGDKEDQSEKKKTKKDGKNAKANKEVVKDEDEKKEIKKSAKKVKSK